jgi:hypothetical protein
MEQSTFDNFFDKYFHPVSKWILLAMRILCGVVIVINIINWNKFNVFAFLFLAVLIYITAEMFDGYRWKRYIESDTGNRRVRRHKKKIWNRVKKQHLKK